MPTCRTRLDFAVCASFLYNLDNQVLTSLQFPGARDTIAQGIDGDNIVGGYDDAFGKYHGFIAVIPEPATILLLALGGMILRRRKGDRGKTRL